jgi:hypothetical protein
MSAIAVVGAVGVGLSAVQANKANKAAKAGMAAGQVDINALDARAREIAQRNAADSAALEQAMTPEVPRLREDANNQVLSQMNPSGWDEYSQGQLTGLAGTKVGAAQTPLLKAAIAKARADLALGGSLPQDVRNSVTRSSLAKAGSVAPGSLGLGRDINARDLGLTSLDLERNRLQAASQLGGQELQLANSDRDTAFNNNANLLNAVQMLQGIQGNQFGRAMNAAQYGQSIQRPVVGLDPGSVVDLTVGNSNNASAAAANRANIYGAQSQNYLNMAGQLGGAALMNYNKTGSTSRVPDNGLSYV